MGSLIVCAGFTRELDRLMTVMRAKTTFMACFPQYIIIRVGYLYLTDPFMSHLATQLGYSAGEFQALQLIVLATFGVVD